MSLKSKILKEAESLDIDFKDIKNDFISILNSLCKGYDKIALDSDGSIGRWLTVKNIGAYVYKYLTENYDSLEEWLDATNGSHWSDKNIDSKKFPKKDLKGLIKAMYYGSRDYQCIGIDDLYVFVLK